MLLQRLICALGQGDLTLKPIGINRKALGLGRSILVSCLGLLAMLQVGCSFWSQPIGEPPGLPQPKLPLDTVTFEVATVRTPVNSDAYIADAWNEVDEQNLSTLQKRRLNSNGLRCGIVGVQMPQALRNLVDGDSSANETTIAAETNGIERFLADEAADDKAAFTPLVLDAPTTIRRLPCRAGSRNEIVCGPTVPEMIVLSHDESGVTGKTYRGAQCVFAMKCFPQGDGSVRLQLVPEIHHGQARQKWIGGNSGAWQLDASRAKKLYDQLTIEVTLTPGQSLLLGATEEKKALGSNFFANDPDQVTQQKLLLIRLAQTQRDSLFDTEREISPLVTDLELSD